ncbi:hypothetical protein [Oceanobacillus iheyensis]|nr:hypothetical protein [Oceanobacillus iheyensis]
MQNLLNNQAIVSQPKQARESRKVVNRRTLLTKKAEEIGKSGQ